MGKTVTDCNLCIMLETLNLFAGLDNNCVQVFTAPFVVFIVLLDVFCILRHDMYFLALNSLKEKDGLKIVTDHLCNKRACTLFVVNKIDPAS